MIAAAKRVSGLEEVIAGMKPQKVEERAALDLQNDYQQALQHYFELLDNNPRKNYDPLMSELARYVGHIKAALPPVMIEAFLKDIMLHNEDNEPFYTGMVTAKLIQNSYNYGYNDFQFHLPSTFKGEALGINLCGTPQNPIRVSIQGPAGQQCGFAAKYCHFTIEDELGEIGINCGRYAQNCNFVIDADVHHDLGLRASESKFYVNGDVGGDCGKGSLKCLFDVKGKAGFGFGANARGSKFHLQGKAARAVGSEAIECAFDVDGDIGGNCGNKAKNSTFKVADVYSSLGNGAIESNFHAKNVAGDCGKKAIKSNYHVEGSCMEYLGREAQDCSFDVGKCNVIRNARKSRFIVRETIYERGFIYSSEDCDFTLETLPEKIETRRCRFSTHHPAVLEKLHHGTKEAGAVKRCTVPWLDPGNRVIFINPDGTETVVRDY